MKIYADHAATTKMSDAAINTLLCMSKEVWGNPSSLYEQGQKAKEVLEQAREDVASVINADPKEIYFTSGGSEADNQAILTAAEIGRKQGKKHIISSAFEHHAVLHTLEKLRKEGFDITLLDVHENGIILPCEVEDAIRDDTCLVTIMYANNEIGTIQPIREIGEVCRRKRCCSTQTLCRQWHTSRWTSRRTISTCFPLPPISSTARRAPDSFTVKRASSFRT